MKTALVTHDDCIRHEISPDHPECPQRIAAVRDALMKRDLYDFLHHHDATEATYEHLLRAHPAAYLDLIHAKAPSSGSIQLDQDTAMNAFSLQAALLGAGAGVQATDLVLGGQAGNAFCLVRPPGHHAERIRAMGFCLFGNIAIAARHALEHHGLDRVAILDFDVHHGNGTEDIVDGDARILFCSSFQHPFYPGDYRADVDGQRVNVPLSAGTTGPAFRAAIEAAWMPALERFAPQMLFVSAGFDAHAEDPLASLQLQDDDYAWITTRIMDLADRHADGRVVSMLEGGYALPALGRSAAAHIRVMMGLDPG